MRISRRRWLWAVAIVGLLVAGSALWPGWSGLRPAPEAVSADYMENLAPQLRTYLEAAIQQVREAPRDAQRHATLGLVYAANELWAEARHSILNAESLGLQNELSRYYVAVSTLKLGDPYRAVDILRGVTERYPQFAPAHDRLGDLLLKKGDLDGAEREFRRVIELAPREPLGYLGLGDVENRRDNHSGAAKLLATALEIDPTDRTAHYLLGLALRGLGRTEDAERELALGLSAERRYMKDDWLMQMTRHVKDLANQLGLARVAMTRGSPARAVEILEEARRWNPDDVWVLNDLACAYLKVKRLTDARKVLNRAFEIGENRFMTLVNLAACDLREQRYEEALRHCDTAIELAPTTVQAYLTRALCLMRIAPPRYGDAREALEAALTHDPSNAEALYRLGGIFGKLGNYAKAAEHFRKTVKVMPTLLEAHLGLCDALMKLRRMDEAKKALEIAMRIAPKDPRLVALRQRLGGGGR